MHADITTAYLALGHRRRRFDLGVTPAKRDSKPDPSGNGSEPTCFSMERIIGEKGADAAGVDACTWFLVAPTWQPWVEHNQRVRFLKLANFCDTGAGTLAWAPVASRQGMRGRDNAGEGGGRPSILALDLAPAAALGPIRSGKRVVTPIGLSIILPIASLVALIKVKPEEIGPRFGQGARIPCRPAPSLRAVTSIRQLETDCLPGSGGFELTNVVLRDMLNIFRNCRPIPERLATRDFTPSVASNIRPQVSPTAIPWSRGAMVSPRY
jgi:hypothetical protein